MKKYQPRLIVRDFNWDSAISESLEGTDAKTNFCGLLNFNGKVTENTKKTKFNMWPLLQDIQNNDKLSSYITRKNKNKTTCPDRVIYDNTVYAWESGEYSPVKDKKGDWLFDHAALICELRLKAGS